MTRRKRTSRALTLSATVVSARAQPTSTSTSASRVQVSGAIWTMSAEKPALCERLRSRSMSTEPE
ncbi:hypothetical protein ACWEQN_46895, partial [Streptomyces sp. NPDC004129]